MVNISSSAKCMPAIIDVQ